MRKSVRKVLRIICQLGRRKYLLGAYRINWRHCGRNKGLNNLDFGHRFLTKIISRNFDLLPMTPFFAFSTKFIMDAYRRRFIYEVPNFSTKFDPLSNFLNDELYIILKSRNLEIPKHSFFKIIYWRKICHIVNFQKILFLFILVGDVPRFIALML